MIDNYGDYLQIGTLHLANDVVALAEKNKPFVEDRLLLVGQVFPLGHAVVGLERRLR